MRIDLVSLLMEYGCPNSDSAKETVISGCTLSILQIRDRLYLFGKILYEDLDNQVYVAAVRVGYGNMNSAVVAIQLQGEKLLVAGYAKEGIIKQNICERAFQKLADAAHGKQMTITTKPKWIFPTIFSLIIVVTIVSVCTSSFTLGDLKPTLNQNTDPSEGDTSVLETTLSSEELAFNAEVELTIDATKAYNDAVEVFNLRVDEYNEAVRQACVDNIVGFPASLEHLALVSESYEDNAAVVEGTNSKEKIAADTATVLDMANQVEQATLVVKQITAPSGEWVADRLSGVEGIGGVQAVTEEKNPDGLLGKEGGYSDCIYFTVAAAIPDDVPGDSIVAKGTDAGGAVEIYSTLADAEARVEYLAGFDGTVLYSGSYAIVGTMVIRTSYKLTNEQQFELTSSIASALTMLPQSD